MANPIAVPGTNVPSGAAVSPGGAQGPSAVSANANNKATLGTDSLVLVQGTAAGVAATTHAQTVSGDDPQLTTLASASTKGLLNQTSGNTTDFIDGTNNSQALQPVIWSARLRSFNAIGNPTFEVDQRNVGTALTNPASGAFIQDRYSIAKSAGLTGTVNTALQSVPSSPIVIPGTNFGITQNFQRFTVGTAQASLAAGDFYGFAQNLEGPRWRELAMDVHSVSLLVRSSVAGLSFTLRLRDSGVSNSLVKLCTIPSANTWTLISLPNLPVWVGTYSAAPGQIAYLLNIFLACGSTYIAAASAAWQTGDIRGVTGMSNLLATAGATFDIAFLKHEPGPQCTTLMDCPFTENLAECERYYFKTYDYSRAVGGSYYQGANCSFYADQSTNADGFGAFGKRMAKAPTVTLYSPAVGTASAISDMTASGEVSATAAYINDRAFFRLSGSVTAGHVYGAHYTADTGW
jgi:hypothetical protein